MNTISMRSKTQAAALGKFVLNVLKQATIEVDMQIHTICVPVVYYLSPQGNVIVFLSAPKPLSATTKLNTPLMDPQ